MAQSGTPITFEAECEKCGLQFTVPIDRFKDKAYVNWVVSGLGLQYTKEGLEGIIETTSQEFYNNIKQDIQAAAACGQCDLSVTKSTNPNCVSNCPSSACGPFKQTLESHTTSCIDWKCAPYQNITSPATLLVMYLPSFMAQSYTSPAEADMSAFLNLLEWCVPFQNKIADMQLVQQVRESRNAIMHSGTMRMDTAELNVHLSNYIALLEDKQELKGDNKCQEAIENIKMIRDADVEMKQLTKIEQEVFDKVDQTHNLDIDELRQKLESNECSTEEAKTLKEAAKELEENHAKLKVLHEVYKLDTTDVDKRKTKCTTLYEDVEQIIERTVSQAHETQLKDLKQHLDEEKNKSAKIQQSYKENQSKIDTLQKKLNKKQKLAEMLEKHLAPLQKDMRDVKQCINTVEHQTKGFASSHQVSEDGVNATGTTGTIPKQKSASRKRIFHYPRPPGRPRHTEMLIGVQDDSVAQESQSELSDFEGRIRALNEELCRRKAEAARLKRERKKKRKELMKDKEETLKKQMAAYDSKITQLNVELHKEISDGPVKTTVRPQIKHPKVTPPKAIGQTKVAQTTPVKPMVETDSSGPDSSQVSPEIQLDKDVRTELSRPDMTKLTEELNYAVPHGTEEVNGIVSSAVDEIWTKRRYGERIDALQPSDAYFTEEETGSDLISNNKRAFKKLLFELTGEIIRDIYKEEEYGPPVAWHKSQRKQCKFYKGASPPRTVDVLKPVVQQAVVDILRLNGERKTNEKIEWGVGKKMDFVDTILVQELREEERDWVNYDDDECAVKMQVTETIFENLLTDTVQTINRIYRKKQSFLQREASK